MSFGNGKNKEAVISMFYQAEVVRLLLSRLAIFVSVETVSHITISICHMDITECIVTLIYAQASNDFLCFGESNRQRPDMNSQASGSSPPQSDLVNVRSGDFDVVLSAEHWSDGTAGIPRRTDAGPVIQNKW